MVSLTHRAAEKIRVLKDGKKYIRLEAEGGKDTNVSYNLDYTDAVNKDDILYMSYGIKILVGSITRRYFENLKVDYTGVNGSGKFEFNTVEVLAAEM